MFNPSNLHDSLQVRRVTINKCHIRYCLNIYVPWNAHQACPGSSNQKDNDETETEEQSGYLGENHKKRPLLPMCPAQFADSNAGSKTPELKQVEKALATLDTSENRKKKLKFHALREMSHKII